MGARIASTCIQKTPAPSARPPDAVFERAREHFNEQEMNALVFTLTTINDWNRLAISMRTEVGNYQPKARPVSQTA